MTNKSGESVHLNVQISTRTASGSNGRTILSAIKYIAHEITKRFLIYDSKGKVSTGRLHTKHITTGGIELY